MKQTQQLPIAPTQQLHHAIQLIAAATPQRIASLSPGNQATALMHLAEIEALAHMCIMQLMRAPGQRTG